MGPRYVPVLEVRLMDSNDERNENRDRAEELKDKAKETFDKVTGDSSGQSEGGKSEQTMSKLRRIGDKVRHTLRG